MKTITEIYESIVNETKIPTLKVKNDGQLTKAIEKHQKKYGFADDVEVGVSFDHNKIEVGEDNIGPDSWTNTGGAIGWHEGGPADEYEGEGPLNDLYDFSYEFDMKNIEIYF